jgi:hypothetical protein
MALSDTERAAAWARVREKPLAERIVALSEPFLGTPYEVSPLGEGQGPDPDPLFRYDKVDCLTFVEETLALSLAHAFEDTEKWASTLRYGAGPSYDNRNHLMEAEWLPHNAEKGFLREVTRLYGGAGVVEADEVLSDKAWASPSGRALHLPPERQVTGRYPLWVIPLSAAEQKLATAPSGTLVLVVREDSPFHVTRVSHLGFLVHQGARIVLRHATKGWVNQVTDEELSHFLGRIARHNETDPRKVMGLSLWQVLERTQGYRGPPET